MDLALNNLQRLICHKAQQTKPKPSCYKTNSFTTKTRCCSLHDICFWNTEVYLVSRSKLFDKNTFLWLKIEIIYYTKSFISRRIYGTFFVKLFLMSFFFWFLVFFFSQFCDIKYFHPTRTTFTDVWFQVTNNNNPL